MRAISHRILKAAVEEEKEDTAYNADTTNQCGGAPLGAAQCG